MTVNGRNKVLGMALSLTCEYCHSCCTVHAAHLCDTDTLVDYLELRAKIEEHYRSIKATESPKHLPSRKGEELSEIVSYRVLMALSFIMHFDDNKCSLCLPQTPFPSIALVRKEICKRTLLIALHIKYCLDTI